MLEIGDRFYKRQLTIGEHVGTLRKMWNGTNDVKGPVWEAGTRYVQEVIVKIRCAHEHHLALPAVLIWIGVLACEEVLADTVGMSHRLRQMPKTLQQGGAGDADEVKLRSITLLCLDDYRMTTAQPPQVIRHAIHVACLGIQAFAL